MNPSPMYETLSKEQLYFSCIMGELFFSTFLDEFIDYLGEDNIEKLLSLYREQLCAKGVTSRPDLIKIIRMDFVKMIYALLEARNKTGFQVINDIFMERKDDILGLLDESEGERLYHIGFEVNQPMDLVLYSFHYWIKKFNQTFGHGRDILDVLKFLRFPASQAFQKRVNAYVEIMRIWIRIDEREVMLELFDIHHPLSILETRCKTGEETGEQGAIDSHVDYHFEIAGLFAEDAIWHYAVYMKDPRRVAGLHDVFIKMAGSDNRFHLPFASLVRNPHDGSLYTKMINRQKHMEIEFVTELDSPMSYLCHGANG
jgi:hypothetical protein